MSDRVVTVFVGNLPWHATEDDLARVFEQFPDVGSVRVIQDRDTGRSRGYGFVELVTTRDLQSVLAALDGCQLDGRQLILRPGRPRRRRV